MSNPVISIGECLIDLIAPAGTDLTEATDLQIREGGAPANVAVALSRLGVASRLHAVVGDDSFGERLRARLDREGVDVSTVLIAPGEATTVAFAWSDANGDGHFRIHRNADRLLSPEDVTVGSLKGAEAIVVGSVAMCAEPSKSAVLTALRHATDLGIPVVADLNIRPGLGVPMDEVRMSASVLIASATVVKLSVDDARALWGATSIAEAASALDRFDPDIAVITDGGRGAALRTAGELISREAFAVEAVEPTGAGDAFSAAFISRMIAKGWVSADAEDLRFAMAAGALATTHPGAMDGLPVRSEVEAFLLDRV
jgi:fructokinase